MRSKKINLYQVNVVLVTTEVYLVKAHNTADARKAMQGVGSKIAMETLHQTYGVGGTNFSTGDVKEVSKTDFEQILLIEKDVGDGFIE